MKKLLLFIAFAIFGLGLNAQNDEGTCPTPTGLNVKVEQNIPDYGKKFKITLTWDAVEGAEMYGVYASSYYYPEPMFVGEVTTNEFVEGLNTEGELYFYVRTICDKDESYTSALSEGINVIIKDNADEPLPETPEQPEQPEIPETTSVYRISSVYAEDGFENWDYKYADNTGTHMVSVNMTTFFDGEYMYIDSLFYDDRGNIIELATWQKVKGEFIRSSYVEYTYNEQNLRATRKNYNNFGTTMELGGIYTYTYDENGNLTNWSLAFDGLDEYQKGVITFNEDGQKVSETIQRYDFETYYLRNNQLIEYEYDDKGNLERVDESTYDLATSTWEPQLVRIYEYDEYDNCIMEEVIRTAGGRVQERTFYKYDLSISIDDVYHYVNPEKDFPALPQMNNMLKSFEYYAENDNGELAYVTDFIFDYELTEIKMINNLTVEAESSSSISLSWNKVANAEKYNIYRDGKFLNTVKTTAYTDNNLKANTTYCYTVTAVRENEEYVSSNEACATTLKSDDGNDTPEPDPLDAPANLKATATSASSISLSWDEVEKAESYNIYRGNELLNNVSTTTYKDNNLEADTTYCHTVTAVLDDEESEFSDEACATTFGINTEIEAPANLKAKAESTSSISLSWDEVEDAESYNIYRDGKLLKNVEKNSYTDKNLSENKKYCYTVSAVVNNEESAMSAEACAKTLEFTLDAPENFEANTEDSSSILLTWDEVENAESYNIYQDDELIDDTEDTEYLVKDLEADTKYCFYVTAVNGSKESDESDKDCDRTDKEKEEDDDDEGIEELSSAIRFYPNPVDNELFLATEVRVEEIAIYDVYGRLCCRDASNASTSNSMDTFNVSVQDLEAGVYFVNIKTENGNVVKRFVKN